MSTKVTFDASEYIHLNGDPYSEEEFIPSTEAKEMWLELGGSCDREADEEYGGAWYGFFSANGVFVGSLAVYGKNEKFVREGFMRIYRDERNSEYHKGNLEIDEAFGYEARRNPSIAQLVVIVREKEEEIRKLRSSLHPSEAE
jgi:hypothetical protein